MGVSTHLHRSYEVKYQLNFGLDSFSCLDQASENYTTNVKVMTGPCIYVIGL